MIAASFGLLFFFALEREEDGVEQATGAKRRRQLEKRPF